MALRRIVKVGDPVLRTVCRPVTMFDQNLHTLLDDMHETLDKAEGVGLAAPQEGCCRRFIIMHLDEMQIAHINPEIILQVISKNCGILLVSLGGRSVPIQWCYVTLPNKCKLRAQDRNGNWYEMTLTALGAQCTCHEYAHLDGQLFTDVVEEFVDPEDLEEA